MPSTPLLFNDAAKSPVAPLNYQESHNMPNGTATKQSTERSPPSIDGSSILNSKAGEISSVMNNTVNGDTNGITNSTINHMQDSPYKVLEQWHSKPTHLRLIHVGAGAGGLLVAYKMQKQFTNYELVCYEKYVKLLAAEIFCLRALQESPHWRNLVRESISGLRLRRVSSFSSLKLVSRRLDADYLSLDLLTPTHTPLSQILTGLAFTRRLQKYGSTLRTSQQSISSNSL